MQWSLTASRAWLDLGLRGKVSMIAALPLAALILTFGLWTWIGSQEDDAESWVQHTLEVQANLARYGQLMWRACARMRGYVLTGLPDYMNGYREAHAAIPSVAAALEVLVADKPVQAARCAALRRMVENAIENLEQSGRTARATNGAVSKEAELAVVNATKQAMDRIQAGIEEIEAEESRVLSLRLARLTRVRGYGRYAAVLGIVLCLLATGAAIVLGMGGITARVTTVKENLERMVDRQPLVTIPPSGDEIGALARATEETGQLLADREQRLEQSHAELEAAVEARSASLRQTIRDLEAEIAAHVQTGQQLQKFVSLAQNSHDFVALASMDRKVLFVNRAGLELVGLTQGGAIGREIEEFVPPGQRDRVRDLLAGPILGEGFWQGELQLTHFSGGNPVDVEATSYLVPDSTTGAPIAIANVLRDIRGRKKAEEHQRQVSTMEALGRLASGVAHDFNNILMVVGGWSRTLLETAASDSIAGQAAAEIAQAADRGTRLCHQILSFARGHTSQLRSVNVNAVISGLESMLRRLAGPVDVRLSLDPSLHWIDADPGGIEQVLMNLLANARDAIAGPGTVTIETRNVQAGGEVTLPPGEYVLLAVRDNGAGMDAPTKARIFEPFFSTKAPGVGVGLGLATVFGIVERYRGWIDVDSEPGQGATFSVYFPCTTG